MNLLSRALCTLTAAFVLASPASAQLFRAYVSSTGNDANPCNLAGPCRLLPAALAAVADGGEIWMLDSANFNVSPVEITKSVTILAIPGAVGSVVANGGNAIHVNGPGVKVALRNLVVIHFASSADGINFAQGAALLVEGCEISNVSGDGINAQAAGARLAVKDTVIRGTGNSGVRMGNGVVGSLSRIQVEGTGAAAVTAEAPSTVSLSDGVLSNNGAALVAVSVTSPIHLVVERTVITNNSAGGVSLVCNAPCTGMDANLVGNTISGNFPGGIGANSDNGNLTVTLDGNFVFMNSVSMAGTPTVYTLGNNTIAGMGVAGTLTPLAGQ
jgi:hypothetical protein